MFLITALIPGRSEIIDEKLGCKGAGTPLARGSGRESPDGIQPADGWSMGSKGERSLPLVMGCWGAGTLPDW